MSCPWYSGLALAAPYLALFGNAPPATANMTAILAFGFTATGAIAALLALGSGLALAAANVLSYDLYYKGLHPTASTERRILVARGVDVMSISFRIIQFLR